MTGRLKQRSYQAKDGTEKTVYEVEADSVAADLKRVAFGNKHKIVKDKPAATNSDNNAWSSESF